MATDTYHESAKIYAFPEPARTGSSRRREQTGSVADLASRRLAKTEFGSGWYHEAAIEEAEQDAKR